MNSTGTFFHPVGGPAIVPSARTLWAPTATTYNNQIYLVYAWDSGTYKQLFYNALTTGNYWTGQAAVPGTVRSSFAPSSEVVSGQLHVYYTGSSSYNLLRKRLNVSTWSGEEWLYYLGGTGGNDATTFSSQLWLIGPGSGTGNIRYLLP
jgi:hypothetical protein